MDRPNIILIQADHQRRDWLSCAGHRYARTPAIDALAAAGVRFTRAYSACPLCGPSRMAMLSGRHPHRLGTWINEHPLGSNVPTVAHALGSAGYETVLCGRMHFMGPDQRHGYATRLVGDICRTYPGGPQTDFSPFAGAEGSNRQSLELVGPGANPVLAYDADVTTAAEGFLAARSDTRPLFLTVGWYGPHSPYACPQDVFDATLADVPDDDPCWAEAAWEAGVPWLAKAHARRSHERVDVGRRRRIRAAHAGMIRVLDGFVARVCAAARSLPGDTIVLFTSDHGDQMGEHGLYAKTVFFESSIGVPLIAAPLTPGARRWIPQGGATVGCPVSLLDLPATLAAIAGAPALPGQDGIDLAPLLASPAAAAEAAWRQRPVYADQHLGFLPPGRMVVRGDRKLVDYGVHGRHMHDVVADPGESSDLLGSDPAAGELSALVRDGWDPAAIEARAAADFADLAYVTAWAKAGGRITSELWRPGLSAAELARPLA